MWIAAFFVTVFAGVEFGIATSIILALLIVLFKVRAISRRTSPSPGVSLRFGGGVSMHTWCVELHIRGRGAHSFVGDASFRMTSRPSHQVGFPHTAELGRLPGTHVYRNIKQYEEATTVDGVLVVRFDAPLYFANVMVSDLAFAQSHSPRAWLPSWKWRYLVHLHAARRSALCISCTRDALLGLCGA